MKCALCRKTDALTSFCARCGRVYCKKDYRKSCSFCEPRNPIQTLSIRREKLYRTTVEWVTLPSTGEVGLVDFEMIPEFLLNFQRQSFPWVHTILFKNKKASSAFAKSMTPQGYPSLQGPSRSRSRYSLIEDPSNNEYYLLLNLGAIEKPADFLVNFLIGYLEETQRLMSSHEFDKKLDLALGECYFESNAKSGIPFVYADKNTNQFIMMFVSNVKGAYATTAAISRAINQENLDQAERFISHRLALIYLSFEQHKPLPMELVFELISYYVHIVMILESIKQFPAVHASIAAEIDNWKRSLKRRKPDLTSFMEVVDTNFQPEPSLQSIDKFGDSLSKVLVIAFAAVSPEFYRRSQEATGLLLQMDFYIEKIANAQEAIGPFGNTKQFLALLDRILSKSTRPEVDIYARWGLLQILIVQAQKGDVNAYVRALPHITKFIEILDSSLASIRMENPSFPFNYEDGGTLLHALSHLALLYNDSVNHLALRDAAKKFRLEQSANSKIVISHKTPLVRRSREIG